MRKQITLHNTPYIKRDKNTMVFIDTRNNVPFDFSSLHDEKTEYLTGYRTKIIYCTQ